MDASDIRKIQLDSMRTPAWNLLPTELQSMIIGAAKQGLSNTKWSELMVIDNIAMEQSLAQIKRILKFLQFRVDVDRKKSDLDHSKEIVTVTIKW